VGEYRAVVQRYADEETAGMTLTRVQALIIATGLALVGVAVARAGSDVPAASERVQVLEWRHFADGRMARDSRTTLNTPADPATRLPFSRL
jgi:hypothetical protein